MKNIIFPLTVLVLASCHPKGLRNAAPAQLREIKHHVASRTNIFKDSLLKAGVDTLFVFERGKSRNLLYLDEHSADDKYTSKGRRYSYEAFAEPAYIFWTRQGKYYVHKIDKFDEYKTIEAWDFLQFPLYDHFNKYRGETEAPLPSGLRFPELEERMITPDMPLSNVIRIEFRSGSYTLSRLLSEDAFNPIVTPEREARLKQGISGPEPYEPGNTKANYSLARTHKLYEWTRLVESELFDLEIQKRWEPLTK